MKIFCIIPAAWLPGGTGAPPAPYHLPEQRYEYTICPGDPTRALVAVHFLDEHSAEEAWRATPGVIVLPEHWEWTSRPVPAAAVALFGPWGVAATDTMGQAVMKIRAVWPALRP